MKQSFLPLIPLIPLGKKFLFLVEDRFYPWEYIKLIVTFKLVVELNNRINVKEALT